MFVDSLLTDFSIQLTKNLSDLLEYERLMREDGFPTGFGRYSFILHKKMGVEPLPFGEQGNDGPPYDMKSVVDEFCDVQGQTIQQMRRYGK